MATYIKINNYNKKGNLGISSRVFDSIVASCISRIDGISPAKKIVFNKANFFRLSKPIHTTIINGIVHIKVIVDVSNKCNIQDVTRKITDEINNSILETTETVPFDVQVVVNSII